MDDVLLRLLIAIGLAALGAGLYWGWNRWNLRRLAGASTATPGLEAFRPGTPAILYFTTPDCAVCASTQRPVLQRLQAELGDRLQVFTVAAAAQPNIADYWGVLSVPTTFIIDTRGQPRRVNHGLAGYARLQRQLDEIADDTPARPAGQPDAPEAVAM